MKNLITVVLICYLTIAIKLPIVKTENQYMCGCVNKAQTSKKTTSYNLSNINHQTNSSVCSDFAFELIMQKGTMVSTCNELPKLISQTGRFKMVL